MAERGDRPRRPRSYSERPHRTGLPRHLRSRRHRISRTRWKTVAGCCPGSDSTRSVRRLARRSKPARQTLPETVPVLRQRKYGSYRSGLCNSSSRQSAGERMVAWLAWAGVHLQFLSTGSLRLTVFLQWIWSFLTGQTGVRLIVNHIPLSKQDKDIELPLTSGGRK